MTVTSFTVQFHYSIGNESFSMLLLADVELHHFAAYYTAKNFRSAGKKGPSLLPEQEIRRWNSHWVHKDSNKETSLSLAIGKAIDHYENS
ncbi:hypothetical protein Q4E93_07490 [Flavitalea sp. BT771]|uniref:hypothetical protein n=1 Tax=Flavitalea sp. BT771 TaxID=3063329 RepID=UPI0026E3AFCE|nr:hypothetical protein [Flavitalea sp. BT771]MDO6430423.1 hypothetical protein [Flavitalea sp. BT771]MDV6219437.1 hypothetical protein [Flavitalea sp. BT771]